MDIQLSRGCVIFGGHITIREGDMITIPELGIFNVRAQVFMDECSFQLCIAPRVIRYDFEYIIITGTGVDLEEQRRDFVDDFNHSGVFRSWVESQIMTQSRITAVSSAPSIH